MTDQKPPRQAPPRQRPAQRPAPARGAAPVQRRPLQNIDLLMVFGPMLFVVGLFFSAMSPFATPGLLVGILGALMMHAWWSRRPSD